MMNGDYNLIHEKTSCISLSKDEPKPLRYIPPWLLILRHSRYVLIYSFTGNIANAHFKVISQNNTTTQLHIEL